MDRQCKKKEIQKKVRNNQDEVKVKNKKELTRWNLFDGSDEFSGHESVRPEQEGENWNGH